MSVKFTRSKDKLIAGICRSIADQAKIDVNIVRLVMVVLTAVTSGVALLVYVVAWLALPIEGDQRTRLDDVIDKGKQSYDDYVGKQKAKQPSATPGASPKSESTPSKTTTETFDPYSGA